MALGSTQPLTEMSTRSISWGGKGGRCVRLTTLPPSCAVVMKSGNLNFLELSGHLRPAMGLLFLQVLYTIRSLDTTPKFHTAATFVTVDISYITLRYICDLSLYQTTTASLQVSLVNDSQIKAKENFHVAATLLYTQQNHLTQ